jgi:hypothetical protein
VSPALPTFGNATLTTTDTRATFALPDWSIESYRTFVSIKAALPRVEVDARARTLTCHVADLARLGVDVRALAGGLDDDEAPFLYPDQRYVVDVALRRRCFDLFGRCGFGKSPCLWTFARQAVKRTGKKVLVVAPKGVVYPLLGEYRKFWPDAPVPANVMEWKGGFEAWVADSSAPALGIVNIDLFRKPRDLKALGGVVLDEASKIKQAGGVLWKNVLASFKPVEYVLGCTATPAPNEEREYAAQALLVRAVSSHKEFFADFFDSTEECGWVLRPHARDAYYAFMASWSIWIRDPAVYGFAPRLKPIPPPVFEDVEVALTPEQDRMSRELRAASSRKGQMSLYHEAVGVSLQQRLSQVARGFLYANETVEGAKGKSKKTRRTLHIPSRKPAAVADIVARHALAGERSVVWVQYNEESTLITQALRARGVKVVEVTAETSDAAQYAAVEDLNAGRIDALVAKVTALGFGVNLQGASVCVFSGINDSFEQDHQAFSRVWRDGQENTVHCYYVVTPLEAAMLANVREKRGRWLTDAAEMERAYCAAMRADLDAWRGAPSPSKHRTRHQLSPADRTALAGLRPYRPIEETIREHAA